MAYDDENLPPIEFTPAGETSDEREANLELVQPSPGFVPAANLCCDIIIRDADLTVLDYTAQAVNIRFRIDGLWHAGPQLDRESGDFMLATLKQMAGMNYRERRQRQEGKFSSVYQKKGRKFKLVSQGVPTGERVAIYLDYKKPPMETARELGMRIKMQERLAGMIADESMGNILVVGVPGDGYTSAWKGVLGCADRLTRDFYVIQPKDRGEEEEVINVIAWEYDPDQGQDPMSVIPQLLLKQPDVLAFPDLDSGDLIDRIVEMSTQKSMPIFTRNPGKSCVDGLMRVIAKEPNLQAFVDRLDAVVAMRTIRKLCKQCKIGYQPHPQMLQKLGIPQGRIAELYQPFVHKPGMVDEDENEIPPCPACSGIGFRGRTGIFEMLVLNDQLRKAIVAQPKLDYVQAVAQKLGHVSMFMEGVVLVAKGTTSVDELNRVIKG